MKYLLKLNSQECLLDPSCLPSILLASSLKNHICCFIHNYIQGFQAIPSHIGDT